MKIEKKFEEAKNLIKKEKRRIIEKLKYDKNLKKLSNISILKNKKNEKAFLIKLPPQISRHFFVGFLVRFYRNKKIKTILKTVLFFAGKMRGKYEYVYLEEKLKTEEAKLVFDIFIKNKKIKIKN
jgi:hypothetical protein